jgi:hypothetical protein
MISINSRSGLFGLRICLLVVSLLSACTNPPNPGLQRETSTIAASTRVPANQPLVGTALPVESEKLTALPSPITATLTTLTPMGNAGYLLISQDQLSQPIELAIGQRFTIQLDEGFTWEVRVAKPDILLPLSDPVVGPGFAASFEALQAGQSQLDISGDPLCRQATPPCMRPSLFFSVIVRVK